MFPWELLKKTALLGTDKMPLTPENLPTSIQEILSKSAQNDPEGFFLKASVLLFTYGRAGQNPTKITLPDLALSETETQPYCPPEIVSLWKKLLDSNPFNPYLLEYLMVQCQTKQWVLTEELLVKVLTATPPPLLPKLSPILGVKGKWLSQFNDAWQIPTTTVSKTQWEEGKPLERREYLMQVRQKNPSEALALMEESWPNESAKDRKSWISVLKVHLSPADEPFLDQIHEELTQNPPPLKPVTLETLHLVNQLRLSIKGSKLGTEVAANITKCIKKKTGLLSAIGLTQNNYHLQLPESEVDFWNGDEMNHRFGFDKLSSQKGVSDAEYWLYSLLCLLHPSFLIDFFEGNPQRIVHFFVNAQAGRASHSPAYLYAISEAMTFASPAEIKAFLELAKPTDIKASALLPFLKWSDQESLLLNQLELTFSLVKSSASDNSHQNWSRSFSKAVLQALIKEVQSTTYYNTFSDKDFLCRLGRKLHVGTKEFIFQLQNELPQDWQRHYWTNHFAEVIFKQLEIKEEIEKITAQ